MKKLLFILFFLLFAASVIAQVPLTVRQGGSGTNTITGLIFGHGQNPFTGLANGSNGTVLTMVGSTPTWVTPTGGMAIGNTVTGSSTGAVLFINGTNGDMLAQDNNNFFYDSSCRCLAIASNGNGALTSFSVGSSFQFQVTSAGDLTAIKGVTYSWPSLQGGANTYLKNNGSGALSWATVSGGGGLTNWIDSLATNPPNDVGTPVAAFVAMNAATDVTVVVQPKGDGAFSVVIPDNTTAGGNILGVQAFNGQSHRDDPTQTASGANSSIGGGYGNTTAGNGGVVGGGFFNNNNSNFSFIGGGYQNLIDNADYSSIICGRIDTIESGASRSVILGGEGLTLTQAGSLGFLAGNPNAMRFTDNGFILGNADLYLGTNSGNNPSGIRFYTDNATVGDFPNGTNYLAFRAPNSLSSSVDYTFPNGDGADSSVLSTHGDGTLFWQTVTGGGGGSGTVTSVALTVPSIFSVSGSPVTTSGTLAVTLATQTQNKVFASPNGSTGVPAFRALVAADIPNLDASILTAGTLLAARMPALTGDVTTTVGTVATTIANNVVTYAKMQAVSTTSKLLGSSSTTTPVQEITIGTGLSLSGTTLTGNTGTVTSVGLALPAEFSISNSPITTTGTLTGAWQSQTQNKFFASPNGSSGTPSFRAIVAADVPTLNQNTTGSAATLTTPRAINGTNFDGSAAITVTAAAGTLTGTTLNSTVVTSSLTSVGTLTGGSTGSGFTVALGTSTITGALTETHGGTNQTTYTTGDILYASASNTLSKLAIGSNGKYLSISSGIPAWVTLSALSNPMTTTGDIIYSSDNSGTPARRAIGSSGDVLTVSGGVPVWAAPSGGGGISGATNKGAMYATGATTGTSTGAMTDGQLLIGSSSGNPALATITAGGGTTVTNGANSITISSPVKAYSVTVNSAGPSSSAETDIISASIPANDFTDGDEMFISFIDSSMNNSGGAVHLTVNFYWGANSAAINTGSTIGSGPNPAQILKELRVKRSGNTLWATFTPPSVSLTTDLFAGGSGNKLYGNSFSSTTTIKLTAQWDTSNANVYLIPLAARVERHSHN
jgi:hypothetical protein